MYLMSRSTSATPKPQTLNPELSMLLSTTAALPGQDTSHLLGHTALDTPCLTMLCLCRVHRQALPVLNTCRQRICAGNHGLKPHSPANNIVSSRFCLVQAPCPPRAQPRQQLLQWSLPLLPDRAASTGRGGLQRLHGDGASQRHQQQTAGEMLRGSLNVGRCKGDVTARGCIAAQMLLVRKSSVQGGQSFCRQLSQVNLRFAVNPRSTLAACPDAIWT